MTRAPFVLGLGALVGRAQTSDASEEESGFEPLLNGRGLGDWVGDPKQWSVQDGVIVGRSGDGKVASALTLGERNYGDFELRFEVKVVEGAGGVSIREPGRGPLGIQVEVSRTMATWLTNGQYGTVDCSSRPGQWNAFHLLAQGSSFSLSNNGVPTPSLMAGHQATEGKLSLVLSWEKRSVVQFRNLRIKTLPL